jgi:hypothetical protein
LASQCLALTVVLIPRVRAALSAHLQKHQSFLVELDRTRQARWTQALTPSRAATHGEGCVQDYVEHREKILAKFVSTVGELVHNSASSLEVRHHHRSPP